MEYMKTVQPIPSAAAIVAHGAMFLRVVSCDCFERRF